MNTLFPETELDQKVDALKCDPAKKTFILRRLRMAEQTERKTGEGPKKPISKARKA